MASWETYDTSRPRYDDSYGKTRRSRNDSTYASTPLLPAHLSTADSLPVSTPHTMTIRNHPYTLPYPREPAVAHPGVEITVEQTEDIINVNDQRSQVAYQPPLSWRHSPRAVAAARRQYLVRSREGKCTDAAVKEGCVIHVLSTCFQCKHSARREERIWPQWLHALHTQREP